MKSVNRFWEALYYYINAVCIMCLYILFSSTLKNNKIADMLAGSVMLHTFNLFSYLLGNILHREANCI